MVHNLRYLPDHAKIKKNTNKSKSKNISSTKYIKDKILEAKLVNYIRNYYKGLHSGEGSSKDTGNGVCSYVSMIDTVITNESIAKYLGCKITKEKKLSRWLLVMVIYAKRKHCIRSQSQKREIIYRRQSSGNSYGYVDS